jgi:hypothetical protein
MLYIAKFTKNKKFMKTLVKSYLIIASIVTVILLGIQCLCGTNFTLAAFLETITISIITSAIVMAVWFIIGYLVCRPLVRLIEAFFLCYQIAIKS